MASGLLHCLILWDKLLYVSNHARRVTPSTLEVTYDMIKWGSLEFPVPTGIRYNTIQVVYVDDDSGNILTFHQQWLEAIRSFGPYSLSHKNTETLGNANEADKNNLLHSAYYNGLGIHSLEPFIVCSCVGALAKFVKNVNGANRPVYHTERYRDRAVGDVMYSDTYPSYVPIKNLPQGNNFQQYQASSTGGTVTADYSAHLARTDIYPHIFPVKFTQSEYDKSETGMVELTVEYLRIPEFTINKSRFIGNRGLIKVDVAGS